MGIRKSVNCAASSWGQPYFSTSTSKRLQGFSLVMCRSSPASRNITGIRKKSHYPWWWLTPVWYFSHSAFTAPWRGRESLFRKGSTPQACLRSSKETSMSDVKTKRSLHTANCMSHLDSAVHIISDFPAVFVLSPAHKGTHSHTRSRRGQRTPQAFHSYIANEPKSSKTTPIIRWRSRHHRSLPHYVAFADNTAEQ